VTDVDIDLETATFEDVEAADKPARTRKPRADKGQARGTRAPRQSSMTALANDLLVPYAMLAGSLGMVAPTLSAFLLVRGEKTVDAILNIAKDHPRMLAAMKKASKMGPGTEIATTIIGAAVAGAVDFGKLPPEHPLAFSLGVTDLYAQVHAQTGDDVSMNGHPFAPPPGMVPVPG
jgi:hypothetical protein